MKIDRPCGRTCSKRLWAALRPLLAHNRDVGRTRDRYVEPHTRHQQKGVDAHRRRTGNELRLTRAKRFEARARSQANEAWPFKGRQAKENRAGPAHLNPKQNQDRVVDPPRGEALRVSLNPLPLTGSPDRAQIPVRSPSTGSKSCYRMRPVSKPTTVLSRRSGSRSGDGPTSNQVPRFRSRHGRCLIQQSDRNET